jgi:hypothetical protein
MHINVCKTAFFYAVKMLETRMDKGLAGFIRVVVQRVQLLFVQLVQCSVRHIPMFTA